MNGYAKLGTIGHPMSDQAHLVMTFARPDMGHLNFNWTLTDPKTYTRPIKNERVFIYSPDVEIMEYACMENNLSVLLDGAITPWLQPNDDASVLPAKWEWTQFDLTKPQKFTAVIKTSDYKRDTFASATVDVAGKTYDVVLGPPIRLDFRGLAAEDFKPGKTIAFQAVVSKQTPTLLRVQTFTKGKNEIDAR
jgi:hypothetical protein